jgi:hypothetical protein
MDIEMGAASEASEAGGGGGGHAASAGAGAVPQRSATPAWRQRQRAQHPVRALPASRARRERTVLTPHTPRARRAGDGGAGGAPRGGVRHIMQHVRCCGRRGGRGRPCAAHVAQAAARHQSPHASRGARNRGRGRWHGI